MPCRPLWQKVQPVQFRFHDTQIRVTHADASSLLATVRARFLARQGFALATINVDHLVKLSTSGPFRAAYGAQDLVVADGNPIVWLSRLAGHPVSLVPGSDLVLPLVRLAADLGVGVALVGSTDEALAAASAHLKTQAPGLRVLDQVAPPMGFDPMGEDAATLLARIGASGAGLCLLALGAPKQEILAAQGRSLAPHVGFASIGAGLDFLAGHQNRAPAWMRAIAMEWAWRMLSSPRRLLPRYAACAAILPAEVVKALRQRRG